MVKCFKISQALIVILGLAASTSGNWDDPPLVNTVQSAVGNVSLNFGQSGVHQQIALFLVNSNDPAGFHVNFTFANKGFFTVGTRYFPMSNVVLTKVSGSMLPGTSEPSNTALTIDAVTGIATWSPAGPPTGATDNLLVAIYADWADQSAKLAGFYMEDITAAIVSGP